jgi:formylglycine-generating enzyme required for sulfatase activity
MSLCLSFFRFVARAALECVGFGAAGELFADVVPDLAVRLYRGWAGEKDPEEAAAELRAVAATPDIEAARLAEQAILLEFAPLPANLHLSLVRYLTSLPASVRQTCPGNGPLIIGRPLDVMPLLPTRLPRFRAGQAAPGFSDWTLDTLLGMGGFGEVWKARHPHLPPTALKYCLDPSAARYLRNEADLLGRIISQGRVEGLVALLDTSLNNDPPCLKYEYVPGGDLAALMGKWRKERPARRARLVLGVMTRLAKTLARLHALSPPIVHRDIKPANVLIDANGSPRLADLGIGAVASPQAATVQTTAMRGACTPLYASPQQMRGEPASPRDDVFALGVVWYQMLTGELADRPQTDWREELQGKGIDEAGVEVLGRCLAVKHERRWADAGELLRQLEGLHEPGDDGPEEEELGDDPLDTAARLRRSLARAQEGLTKAMALAEERRDYLGAVKVLERLPEPFRDEALIAGLRERHETAQMLRRRIRQDSKRMQFEGLHGRILEYLKLAPDDEEVRRLLEVVPYKPGREVNNDVGMRFVLIESGQFLMGSPEHEQGRYHDEGPAHRVSLERPYYLGTHPVTQEQYQRVMGNNPSRFRSVGGQDARLFPVEMVSWEDAAEFCRRLAELPDERARGHRYRLPTEAEWEHACRANCSGPFTGGNSLGSEDANFDGRHPYGSRLKGTLLRRPSVVGTYRANAFGLYDMHGNVWEWCHDWYGKEWYRRSPETSPSGPKSGEARVLRGGSWQNHGKLCRSAARDSMTPGYRGPAVGFRVVLEVTRA